MSDGNNDPPSNGPRTLDGKPVEGLPEEWSRPATSAPSRQAPARAGGIATLFNTGLHAGMTRNDRQAGRDDDGDDDEGDRRDPQEFFNGGEASGLAVENPNQGGDTGGARGLVERILKQAQQGGTRGPDQPSSSGRTTKTFGGSGNRLGSEDDDPAPTSESPAGQPSGSAATAAPTGPRVMGVSSSQFDQLLAGMFGGGGGRSAAPPPPPQEVEEEEVQHRRLTFWRNGFSIEDGPLMAYDAPGNKEILEAIELGRAPPSLFGVRYNQPLQVGVEHRTNEDYVAPPKVLKPFGGGGNRLGSSVPEVSSAGGSGASTPNIPGGFGAAPQSAGSSASSSGTDFKVDDSQPTTSIQMRLGDGTRLVAKVNLTHTIGDLRAYVRAARPDSRNFVLQTTFPTKELSDESQTVEEAKLQNAVVVQRFV